MSKQQNQVTALVLPSSPNESSEIGDFIKEYLYHWPLFVVGVLIAMTAAYYYLAKANPVYPVTATIQFINPATDSDNPDDNSIDQLDLVSKPVNVEDEISVIKSKKLFYKVVQNLQLWVNYTEKKGIQTINLYKRSPVLFNFIDTSINLSLKGEAIKIVIKNSHSFLTEDESGKQKLNSFSAPVKSNFGIWQLKPNANINDYIGAQIIISIQDPDLVSDDYVSRSIKIEQETKEGAFLSLSMSDEVPSRGRDILNSLLNLYGLNTESEKNDKTQKILDFLSLRIDSLKQNLDSSERTLAAYKQKEGISDLDEDAGRYRRLMEANSLSLSNVDVQLSTLTTLENYASSSSGNGKLPLINDLADENITAIYSKLTDLQSEREDKLAITPEANPLFISINNQISTLKKDLDEKVKTKINTIKSSLLANKDKLQTISSGLQAVLNRFPSRQQEYDSLKRDQDSKEKLYNLLTSKREELALQYTSLNPDFKIVDDAHVGRMKWPIPPIVYGLALVFGLGLPVGIIYMRKAFNERILNRKQIEEETEVAVLGEIAEHYSKNPIVVSQERSNFIVAEQFRVLRTSLYHLLGSNEGCRVTLFTSSVSGEGKSFISSNLAVTLAYSSRKTIILEMDLRKPKVLGIFGLSNEHPGISDYLAGKSSDICSLIRPSGIPRLDILGCGTILPNPSELLETERLDNLIEDLKTRYEDIIIDSPPIHVVADALIISRTADACLYVVRQGYTHKDELGFIKEIYDSKRFNKFSLVLNGAKREGGGYGNYSYYNAYAGKEKWSFGNSIKTFLKRF